MSEPSAGRRRGAVQITRQRASRLYRLVRLLGERPRTRDEVLKDLSIGLRTFYRELDLLKRCGLKVRHKDRLYALASSAEKAESRLPFPDPQLTFAEMAELSRCEGEAGRRLAALLAAVTEHPLPPTPRAKRPKGR